jgi:mRNA interferase HigB
MRLIAAGTLREFGVKHPETKVSLGAWMAKIKEGRWTAMGEVQASFPNAKALNGERVRFQIRGGDYRLIVAFDFRRAIAFVKFVGSHADYDKIDALTVSLF